MSLSAGSKVGGYEIVGLIGAGGMGEVYRARDTRLKRDVAIKALPDAFANDAERLARFQREAELLATLNHPNIAQIYGVEERALVLELVEGPTLADRLARGPIPIGEALGISRQIAEAVEAAHERGVIHRDLKPANIKLTADNSVKVLDFGLARAADSTSRSGLPASGLSHSPTISIMATQAGIILGTAAYMSPEQAKGLPADHRSDIFAFGVVLYEMLTGRRPFEGDTAADVLASVIVRDVDFARLPANLSPRVADLLKRCLAKNPKKRWQAIGDVRAEIEAIAADPLPGVREERPALWGWKQWAALATVGATFLLIGAGTMMFVRRPAPLVTMRFAVPLPPDQYLANTVRQVIDVSPDGSHLLYVANQTLYLRAVTEFAARPVAGGDASQGRLLNPVFSPDGRSIAYYDGLDQTIKRIPITGGPAVTLCSVERPVTGMSWGPDGIVFGQGNNGIFRVSAASGKPVQLARVESGEVAFGPRTLPDGRSVVFTIAHGVGPGRWDSATVVVQTLATSERKILIKNGSDARYVAAGNGAGYLIYAVGGRILAVPFDLHTSEVIGDPAIVVEGVRRSSASTQGTAQLAVSATGTLVYFSGPPVLTEREFGLLDRKANVERLKDTKGTYVNPRVSPDGKRIAFESDDGRGTAIWIYAVDGLTAMRRLTFEGRNRFPIWSSDGRFVAFQSDRDGDLGIFRQRADGSGTPERLTTADRGVSHIPDAWSPRDDSFLFTEVRENAFSVWSFALGSRTATRFGDLRSTSLITPVFSPDGRWLAYTSLETGLNQVFVQPVPPTGVKYQVSKEGGHHAMWTPDGRELLYDVTAGLSHIVRVTVAPTFTIGAPVVWPRGTMLFAGGSNPRPVDMAPDGRVVGPLDAADAIGTPQNSPPIHVVLNWFEELRQRVTTKRD